MSDDTISFFAVLCCAVAFTVALFSWHPSQQVTASENTMILQIETVRTPTSVTRSDLVEPKG